MRIRSVLLISVFAIACREASSEADEIASVATVAKAVKAPCQGCTVDLPAKRKSMPLLVVMHGDAETAKDAAARWRPAALTRGWAILSLECPRDQGCTEASWYKWDGPARWVTEQVAALERQVSIDPQRIYLAGWSGGATYIGSNVATWPRMFAAMVFHGGGQPPTTDGCPKQAIPGYFLVGDRNWAHGAAKRLRAYLESCRQDVTWDLLEGADHPAEDKALDFRKANAILDWLDKRARAPLVSAR